jgi:hypothetical protein
MGGHIYIGGVITVWNIWLEILKGINHFGVKEGRIKFILNKLVMCF